MTGKSKIFDVSAYFSRNGNGKGGKAFGGGVPQSFENALYEEGNVEEANVIFALNNNTHQIEQSILSPSSFPPNPELFLNRPSRTATVSIAKEQQGQKQIPSLLGRSFCAVGFALLLGVLIVTIGSLTVRVVRVSNQVNVLTKSLNETKQNATECGQTLDTYARLYNESMQALLGIRVRHANTVAEIRKYYTEEQEAREQALIQKRAKLLEALPRTLPAFILNLSNDMDHFKSELEEHLDLKLRVQPPPPSVPSNKTTNSSIVTSTTSSNVNNISSLHSLKGEHPNNSTSTSSPAFDPNEDGDDPQKLVEILTVQELNALELGMHKALGFARNQLQPVLNKAMTKAKNPTQNTNSDVVVVSADEKAIAQGSEFLRSVNCSALARVVEVAEQLWAAKDVLHRADVLAKLDGGDEFWTLSNERRVRSIRYNLRVGIQFSKSKSDVLSAFAKYRVKALEMAFNRYRSDDTMWGAMFDVAARPFPDHFGGAQLAGLLRAPGCPWTTTKEEPQSNAEAEFDTLIESIAGLQWPPPPLPE